MTDEIIKQEPPQKKFNWANLPIILAISFISLLIILFTIIDYLYGDDTFLTFIVFMTFGFLAIIPALFCPFSLILQIIHKNKTNMDKVLLGINIIFCVCVIPMLILGFLTGNK